MNKIEDNKTFFENCIRGIKRDGCDIEGFLQMLEQSDFYTAPGTTQYNWSYVGGLCNHSLKVYQLMLDLLQDEYGADVPFDEDTIKIVSLLHDIGKINFYEKYVKNEKIYSSVGKKSDEMGRFDWVSSPAYRVKKPEDRFILGTPEENSLYIIQNYFPLSVEETSAILNSKSLKDKADYEQMYAFSKYKLTLYLFLADMWATFGFGVDIDE